MSSTNNMRRIIFLFLFDVLISSAVAAYLYSARGVDAAFATGLSIFIALSPICLVLAELLPLRLISKKLAAQDVTLNNPAALKLLPDVEVLALPYNRVLTCKEYYVTDLITEGLKQSELLKMAAGAERDAQHIIGRTIYDTAAVRGLKIPKSAEFDELQGRGVEALVNKILVRVGSPGWIASHNVSVSINFRTKIDQLLVKGKTTLLVSTGRLARGIIALKDEINLDARNFLATLRQKKIESLLLTAQPKKMAYRIAKDFELDHIRTNLTPEGKAREVQIFRAKGKVVAAIGTDTQDMLSLKTSDVSFLLKGGSFEPAEDFKPDFEIPTLETFLTLREISLKAAQILKLNRRLALASWIVLVPLAICSALETPPITFNPLMAAAGVAIFSAIILLNSLRLSGLRH